MKKELFFDLETTGLHSMRDGIQQLACVYFEDGVEKDKLNININTFTYNKSIREPSKVALEITGKTIADIKSYQSSKDAFKQFTNWLSRKVNKYDKNDKIILIGYNSASFDIPFLRAWWLDNGDKYYGSFFYQFSVDVYYFVIEAFYSDFFIRHFNKNPDNLKLSTIAEFMGIDINAHDALSDIEATVSVYRGIKKLYHSIGDWN